MFAFLITNVKQETKQKNLPVVHFYISSAVSNKLWIGDYADVWLVCLLYSKFLMKVHVPMKTWKKQM